MNFNPALGLQVFVGCNDGFSVYLQQFGHGTAARQPRTRLYVAFLDLTDNLIGDLKVDGKVGVGLDLDDGLPREHGGD
jgi:hypothetical protein